MTLSRRIPQGFTLVELMIVVSIMGILSAIAIPKMSRAFNRAKEKQHIADKEIIKEVLIAAYSENHRWPAVGSGTFSCIAPAGQTCWNNIFNTIPSVMDDITPFLPNPPAMNVPGYVSGNYIAYTDQWLAAGGWGTVDGVVIVWPMEPDSPASDCPPSLGSVAYASDQGYQECYEFVN